MDFNADGHIDLVSATFDGSPYVSYGSNRGFAEPTMLKDVNADRILISRIWDYKKEEHTSVGRSMPDGNAVNERCISALAYDWDADGDFDLLLGSYESGKLYRQMNEGSNKVPKFTGKNIRVMVGNKQFAMPSNMTTPRLVDWDNDGDMDLVAGTFGDAYSPSGVSGGVYLSLNEGKVGSPRFGKLQTLIAPNKQGATEPLGPDFGLYPDVVDYDGDGDLDLVVGAYTKWKPKLRPLTDTEKKEVAALKAAKNDLEAKEKILGAKIDSEIEKLTPIPNETEQGFLKRMMQVFDRYKTQLDAFKNKMRPLTSRLDELQGTQQQESFVWFFERLTKTRNTNR